MGHTTQINCTRKYICSHTFWTYLPSHNRVLHFPNPFCVRCDVTIFGLPFGYTFPIPAPSDFHSTLRTTPLKCKTVTIQNILLCLVNMNVSNPHNILPLIVIRLVACVNQFPMSTHCYCNEHLTKFVVYFIAFFPMYFIVTALFAHEKMFYYDYLIF